MQQHEASQGQGETSAARLITDFKEEVAEQAHGLAGQAKEAAESQKERLADGASEVAQALHHASEGLRNDDQETVGNYAEALAGQVEKVAQFLQSRDLPTMAREVSGFARRQPALFLGGAFTLGIVAARFLKSSGGGLGQRRSPAGGGQTFYDERDANLAEDSLSQRSTDPVGRFAAPTGNSARLDSSDDDDDVYDGRPDPAVYPPGGVPPLPSAQGGGL